jgi:hypothetical protein
LTHSPSGWKIFQWQLSRKKQWSSSYKALYTGSAYPERF